MRRPSCAGPCIVLLGLELGMVPAALAQTDAAPVVTRADDAVPALLVQVLEGPARLEPDAIRAAVARELGLLTHADPERQHVGKVTIEGLAGPAVSIRYESKDGTTTLERRVTLPVDPARRSLVVSWVVGNLVRNEAAEILSGMTKRPSADEANAVTPLDGAKQPEQPEPSEPVSAAPAVEQTKAPSPPPRAAPPPPQSRTPAVLGLPAQEPELGSPRVINLALFSPVVALHRDASAYRFRLSHGGVYSHIGALNGFGLTWFVDHVEWRTKGVLLSGIWSQTNDSRGFLYAGVGTRANGNLVGTEIAGLVALRRGCVLGAQITGLWATAGDSCKSLGKGNQRFDGMALLGVQVAGLVTQVNSGFRGAQLAGVGAIATDRYEGLQFAGGVAYSKAGYRGAQLGMLGNVSGGPMSGLQLAGAFNYQAADMSGLQLSGGLNRADDVRGLQFGAVNLAREVRGLQLGFVNVARENHGLMLGLFNWSSVARLQPTYFFQTPGLHSVGYRNISGHSVGAISFGYDPARDIARTHFAVGARSDLGRFALGLEFGYGWVLQKFSSERTDRAHELDLIGTATLEIVKDALSIYGGGGLAVPVAGVVPNEPRGLAQAGISIF